MYGPAPGREARVFPQLGLAGFEDGSPRARLGRDEPENSCGPHDGLASDETALVRIHIGSHRRRHGTDKTGPRRVESPWGPLSRGFGLHGEPATDAFSAVPPFYQAATDRAADDKRASSRGHDIGGRVDWSKERARLADLCGSGSAIRAHPSRSRSLSSGGHESPSGRFSPRQAGPLTSPLGPGYSQRND